MTLRQSPYLFESVSTIMKTNHSTMLQDGVLGLKKAALRAPWEHTHAVGQACEWTALSTVIREGGAPDGRWLTVTPRQVCS